MWILGSLACRGDEAPTLLYLIDGDWYGYIDIGEGQWPAEASLLYDDEEESIEGSVTVEEPEQMRSYELLSADEVEVGLALSFIEVGGVHELYLDALEPLTPFWWGSYRTRWFCEGEPDGYCHVDGLFRFDPLLSGADEP